VTRRLDDGNQVVGVDLEDPVHPGEHQDNAAMDRKAAAGEAAARAPWQDRDPLAVGQANDLTDFLGASRVHHQVGQMLVLGGVKGMGDPVNGADRDVGRTDDCSDPGQKAVAQLGAILGSRHDCAPDGTWTVSCGNGISQLFTLQHSTVHLARARSIRR
jgi:hypothetical protein